MASKLPPTNTIFKTIFKGVIRVSARGEMLILDFFLFGFEVQGRIPEVQTLL